MGEPAEEQAVDGVAEAGQWAGTGAAAIDHGGVRRPSSELTHEPGDDADDVVVTSGLRSTDRPLGFVGNQHASCDRVWEGGG